MIGRALVVWLALLVLAFAGAAAREGLLTPRIGAVAGHVVGTFIVVALFLVTIAFTDAARSVAAGPDAGWRMMEVRTGTEMVCSTGT